MTLLTIGDAPFSRFINRARSDMIAERSERDEEGSDFAHVRAEHVSLPPSRDLLDPP